MAFISLKSVYLDYPVYNYSTRSWKSHLVNLTSSGIIKKKQNNVCVRALEDISFELQAGDTLALVGGNGAGKTTLLKTMAGIYHPTSGNVMVSGSKSCIFGAGFGMDDDATGYENIILGCIALGHSLKEAKSKIDDIEEFTELGSFLNMPLRSYSAGMRARLAFAVATCSSTEILLMDEGLGAGDASFVEKAKKRLDKFTLNARILVLASHSESLLRTFCNKGLLLKAGRPVAFGDLETVLQVYNSSPEYAAA